MPVWQVFVLSQDNVKNKGYVTLFQYMTKNKKSLFARVVMSAPEVLQVPVLYLCLFCFALVLYYVVTQSAPVVRCCWLLQPFQPDKQLCDVSATTVHEHGSAAVLLPLNLPTSGNSQTQKGSCTG